MKIFFFSALLFTQHQIWSVLSQPVAGDLPYSNEKSSNPQFQFAVTGWNDFCSAIYNTLTNSGIQFSDIETISVKGTYSRTGDSFSLQFYAKDLLPVQNIENLIDVNSPLTVDILMDHKEALVSWLNSLGIPYNDDIDLCWILEVEPGVTLNSIKTNEKKWKTIFAAPLQKRFFNIDTSIEPIWISQNVPTWTDILVSQGVPKNLVESVDWEHFMTEFPFVTPSWINKHPKEFMVLLLSVQDERRSFHQPLDIYALLTPEFVQQYLPAIKLKGLEYNMPFEIIDWDLVLNVEPTLTFSKIEQNLPFWREKFNLYVKLSNILRLYIDPNINIKSIMENPTLFNDILSKQGIPTELLRKIDWETYFLRFPHATPNWISNNPKEFIISLLQMQGQKLEPIDVNVHFSIPFVNQNKDRLRLWFYKNRLPWYDGLDWDFILKHETPFTLNDILRNLNNWIDKFRIYTILSMLPPFTLPTDLSITKDITNWISILLEKGFPPDLLISIDWNLFVLKYPYATPSWIVANRKEFLYLLFSTQGQKLEPSKIQKRPGKPVKKSKKCCRGCGFTWKRLNLNSPVDSNTNQYYDSNSYNTNHNSGLFGATKEYPGIANTGLSVNAEEIGINGNHYNPDVDNIGGLRSF